MSSVILTGLVGEIGVCQVFRQLSKHIYCEYIHNLPLSCARTMRQIDAVLLTQYGFYSVEVKNWKCTLHVDPTARYWRADYPTESIPVPSPLAQNNSHIRNLQRCITRNFGNLILFPDDITLVNPVSYTIRVSELVKFFENKPIVYTKEEVQEVFSQLKQIKQDNEARMIASFILKGNKE